MTALLPVPPLAKPVKPKPIRTVERVLPSGLRVVAVRQPSVPMVEVRLRIPFFSTKPSHPARYRLLASAMLTGTEQYDRAGLAIALGELGADLNVSVDADRLVLSSAALPTGLPALLRLYAEVLTGARYPTGEVAGERERLVKRITISRSQAGALAADALASRIAPGHPYGHTLPSVPHIEATTAGQLRTLHAGSVRPAGALLVLVGDLSPARAIDAVEAALAGWTGAAQVSPPVPVPALRKQPLLIVDRPGSVQTALRLGGPALPRDDSRYPALQLANLAFGGYFCSRWVENIREQKGYSYAPRSVIEHGVLASTFMLAADVATAVTAPAMLETLYELGRIASLPITAAELDSVQQYAIGSLALSTATQAGLASMISNLLGSGLNVEWLSSHPARVLKVGRDEIAEVAAEFLAPRQLVAVAVGDAGAITEPLTNLIEVE
ncbi:MAG TPA: pitrilysin family protein [Jatrophihabitans sp.]|nr:pitrilysin family protein [Jatrophihabitans sp.]